jgi:hypothetical protein
MGGDHLFSVTLKQIAETQQIKFGSYLTHSICANATLKKWHLRKVNNSFTGRTDIPVCF